MKKITSKIAVCASVFALCIAGTAMLSYADTTGTESTEEERQRPQDDGAVSAKVVSVSGSTLTVYLEERQQPPTDGEAPAEGETPPEKPEGEEGSTDGTTPPEKPADGEEPPALPEGEEGSADGTTPPEGGVGGGMGHGGGMNATYSEETTALTVTSSTTVTEGMEQTSVSISTLEEGDIVRLVLDEDGTTVVSISVMNMEPPAEASAESE